DRDRFDAGVRTAPPTDRGARGTTEPLARRWTSCGLHHKAQLVHTSRRRSVVAIESLSARGTAERVSRRGLFTSCVLGISITRAPSRVVGLHRAGTQVVQRKGFVRKP